MKRKLDAKTRAKAIKGLEKTRKEGTYYWREKAASAQNALKNGLPLRADEWKFWAKKGSGR